MDTIADLTGVPLALLPESTVDAIVRRLVPDGDAPRVPVAAFNSSI